jgi:hypothetical protein
MEDKLKEKRMEALAGLEDALEEIESGEGLSTFVEGHGLQSRRFRFEWHEPVLHISYDLPTGRVLASEEERKADDESIEYARQLETQGKVYSAEQWENHDIQCQIAKPNLRNRDAKIGTYGKMKQNVADDYSTHAHYVTYSNTFFRDFFVPLLKGTNRVNWFGS